MNYPIVYTKLALKHALGSMGLFGLGWRLQLTSLILSIFWLADIPVVVLTFGKARTCFHEKAGDVWFDFELLDLAQRCDPKWAKKLLESIQIVILA